MPDKALYEDLIKFAMINSKTIRSLIEIIKKNDFTKSRAIDNIIAAGVFSIIETATDPRGDELNVEDAMLNIVEGNNDKLSTMANKIEETLRVKQQSIYDLSESLKSTSTITEEDYDIAIAEVNQDINKIVNEYVVTLSNLLSTHMVKENMLASMGGIILYGIKEFRKSIYSHGLDNNPSLDSIHKLIALAATTRFI